MALSTRMQCLRRIVSSVLDDVASTTKSLCPETFTQAGGIQVVHPADGPNIAPPLLLSVDDDCKKLEKRKAKTGPVCKAPDLKKKPIPPYQYGYCKDAEPELPMSCPPKATKRKKGPCCLNEAEAKRGGCKGH